MKTIIIDGVEYNITPKALFKKGDWITTVDDEGGIEIEKVVEFLGNKVRLIDTDGVYTLCPQSWLNYYHLWTIQDAKDGDVLEFGDHGRLVVGIVSYVNKTTGKVDVNCLLENNNFKVGNYYNLDTIKPHPAAKEQRDLLFKKMKEAGYEWDAEKKELKKIEPKPAENKGMNLVEEEMTPFQKKVFFIIDTAIEEEQGLKQVCDELLRLAHDEIMQNPAWSEEDEEEFQIAIDTLVKAGQHDSANWLKSLKDRVQHLDLARKELLKDLPKWKRSNSFFNTGNKFELGKTSLRRLDGYEIPYSELEKLPKEE